MHWYYRLGHLASSKLEHFGLNGKIPQRLAKVKPPACSGCLFCSMAKAPWKGQETSSKVFVATKVGQCVSINQMILTQVGVDIGFVEKPFQHTCLYHLQDCVVNGDYLAI